jgi:hypothetical protein
MIMAGLTLTHLGYAQDTESRPANVAQRAPEADACSGVPLPLTDCLEVVAQIGRFLDSGTAPQPAASDDVAETVCERASASGPACRDTVARMKDWSDATLGSSLPRRPKKRDNDRHTLQWRAPSVGAYERK